MALNKEVWVSQILEGFYPDDSFLKRVVDYSQFVENNKLHVASAGIDPKVLINNTTYPINVVGRDDDDNVITLDKFETENTLVRRPEALEYSYDKLESVIRQHRATLGKSIAMKAAHAFAPDKDTTDTPLVVTTGETANGRKRLRLVDILTLKERFDDAEIPLEDRYIVLHPKHITDLLLEDTKLFKEITNIREGEPFKFAGFGFYSFSQMPVYRLAEDSIAFYAKEVMKADGNIYMYSTEDDPKERATIVGFDKRFVALSMRGKGIGAIISATA